MSLLDKFVDFVMYAGLPVAQVYHLLCGNLFLNSTNESAEGMEKIANYALAPTQYLLCGTEVKKGGETSPRFSYDEHFLVKTATSMLLLPVSVGAGTLLKGASYLIPETRAKHHSIVEKVKSSLPRSNFEIYRSMGMKIKDFRTAPLVESEKCARPPMDPKLLQKEKEALREIASLLHAHKIPFWVDCGTLLGTYRYGGIIPWDWDIDIAILAPDFDNVKSALSALDPEKYGIQDWSGRECPKSYLKVYVKGTKSLIDIYHFTVDPQKKVVRSIFSNEGSPFLPESMKIRERRYTVDTPFDLIFPLKRAFFDGIEVPVPGKIKEYLQLRYGENLAPAKIYNPETGAYEKDLSHPYWKIAHVH